MAPYLVKFGSFEIRYYSVFIILGLLFAIFMCRRRAKALGYDYEKIESVVLFVFFIGLIGARAYYVFLKWDYYSAHLSEIFAVWHGGLAIHGGIIGGAVGAVVAGYYYKIKFLMITDLLAPWLLMSQGIGRLGNFMNGEAHGVPTMTPPSIIFSFKPDFIAFWNAALTKFQLFNTPESVSKLANIAQNGAMVDFNGKEYLLKEYVPWGISFSSKYMPAAYIDFGTLPVHPTFFYEMILNFIGAFILYLLWRKNKWISTGVIFGLYLIFYGVIRAFVTFFRADDLMVGFLRAPHVASLALIIIGTVLLLRGIKKTSSGVTL